MVFKCRVMNNIHSKIVISKLMGGYWQHHMNIIQLMYPVGLHREFYQLDFKDGDLNCIPVKYRISRREYKFDKKNYYKELNCAYV